MVGVTHANVVGHKYRSPMLHSCFMEVKVSPMVSGGQGIT
jgi:hypothetical protein